MYSLSDADEENRGKGFFEGDMMLSPDQQKLLDQLKDGALPAKRALIKNTTYLWPNARVYYTFDDNIGKSQGDCMYCVTPYHTICHVLLCHIIMPQSKHVIMKSRDSKDDLASITHASKHYYSHTPLQLEINF